MSLKLVRDVKCSRCEDPVAKTEAEGLKIAEILGNVLRSTYSSMAVGDEEVTFEGLSDLFVDNLVSFIAAMESSEHDFKVEFAGQDEEKKALGFMDLCPKCAKEVASLIEKVLEPEKKEEKPKKRRGRPPKNQETIIRTETPEDKKEEDGKKD